MLAVQVAYLAGLGECWVADWVLECWLDWVFRGRLGITCLAANIRIKMSKCLGAVSILWDRCDMDVVD